MRLAIWRRKRVFLSCFAVLFAVSTLYVLTLKPRYFAEGLILLPETPMGSLTEGSSRVVVAIDPMMVRSETDILGSNDLARRVIAGLDLGQKPEFTPRPPPAPIRLLKDLVGEVRNVLQGETRVEPLWSEKTAREDALLSAYKQRLYVFNDGRSAIVHVGFTASTPDLAARVANAHVEAYLDAQVERRVGSQRLAVDWLKGELDGRAKELRDAEVAVQSYRAQHNLVLVQHSNERQESLADQELRLISEQLVSASLDETRDRARLAQFNAPSASGILSATTEVLDNPVIVKLRQREAEARTTLNRVTAAAQPGGLNPLVESAKADLKSVEDTLRRELTRSRESISSDLRQAEARVGMLQSQVKKATAGKITLDQAEIELKGRETYAAAKRSIYQIVLNRYNTLLAEQGFNGADAKVISTASVPTRPAFPKTSLFLAFATLASAAGAAAAAFATDRLPAGVRKLRRLSSSLGVHILGVVPLLGPRAHLSDNLDMSGQLFWERVRGIRNRIIDLHAEDSQVVLVTSALPQEGKSLFAGALARAVASAGVPTILIDGDLHRPTAASTVGVSDVCNGLGEVLAHQVSLNDAIVPTSRGNLALLAALPSEEGHSDSLATEGMGALLRTLKASYRVIVVDSPPLAVSSDALALSGFADQTIIIARAGRMSAAPVSQAVNTLLEHDARLAGLVLVGDDQDDVLQGRSHDYYRSVRSSRPAELGRRARLAVRESGLMLGLADDAGSAGRDPRHDQLAPRPLKRRGRRTPARPPCQPRPDSWAVPSV